LTLDAGSTVKLILWENPSARYTWDVDTKYPDGYFGISNTEFIPSRRRDGRTYFGSSGQRVYTLEVGPFGGECHFFAWIKDGNFGAETAELAERSGYGFIKIPITVNGPSRPPTETVDLSDATTLRNLQDTGYTLQPHQTVHFDFPENGSTGFRW